MSPLRSDPKDGGCLPNSAGPPMRQWLLKKEYSPLIDLLPGEEDVNVALIGGEDEAEIAVKVLDRADRQGRILNLLGKLSLEGLRKLLAKAALFVGNNSDRQHLAGAIDTPTLEFAQASLMRANGGRLGRTW